LKDKKKSQPGDAALVNNVAITRKSTQSVKLFDTFLQFSFFAESGKAEKTPVPHHGYDIESLIDVNQRVAID